MALGFTAVNAYTSAGSFGTGGYTTAAFTPASNSLLCVAVVGTVVGDGSVNGSLTLSGGGLTWTQVPGAFGESLTSDNDFTFWFTAPVGTGASMTLTADCGARDMYRYILFVFTLTGYNTGSPIGGVGSYGNASGGTPVTFSLSSSPASTSYVIAASESDGGTTIVGTGWNEEFFSNPDIASSVESRTGSTSATVTWNQLTTGAGTSSGAIEIKEASAVVLNIAIFTTVSVDSIGGFRRG